MRFLFFSPFQAIEKHSFPESFIAKVLRDYQHDVMFMGCEGILKDFCISHSAYGLTEVATVEDRLAVCRVCKKNRDQVSQSVGRFHNIEDYYSSQYDVEIKKKLAELTVNNIYDTDYRGYAAGQFASYEFILSHKLGNMALMTDIQFHYFKYYFRNVLRAIHSFERFFQEVKIDKVLVYNSAYSINSTMVEVARKFGIPTMFVHAGLNLKHMADSVYFSHETIVDYNINSIRYFLENRDRLGLDFNKMSLPLDHVSTCYNAKSVFTYSSARDPQKFRSLKEKLYRGKSFRKVALLTMSSGDETYAADFAVMKFSYVKNATRVFDDPFIWVRETIRHYRSRPDCLLLIRIHPREFPNKRETATSSRVKEYEKLFEDLPENVIIDHPSDGNSIYDIFELVDFQIAAQSTAGVEGTLLGVPLVSTVTRLGMYPIPCLADCPKSEQEYFSTIDRMNDDGFQRQSRELIFRSLQWYLYLHNELQFNFSTENFWDKVEDRAFVPRFFRYLRRKLGIPRYSIHRFLAGCEMAERDRSDLEKLLSTVNPTSEVYNIREPAMLARKNAPEFVDRKFEEFVVGLVSLYYRSDFSKFVSFAVSEAMPENRIAENHCIFVIDPQVEKIEERRIGNSSIILLPKEAKLAASFATILSQFHTQSWITES
jgi:hypothetical protein